MNSIDAEKETTNLSIKDFPADLHRALKSEAIPRGLSLRDYIISILINRPLVNPDTRRG